MQHEDVFGEHGTEQAAGERCAYLFCAPFNHSGANRGKHQVTFCDLANASSNRIQYLPRLLNFPQVGSMHGSIT